MVVGDRRRNSNTGWGWKQQGVSISYIRQHAPLGLAHGVKVSEHHLKGDTFVTILGDNLIMHPVEDLVRHHMDTGARSTILLSRVEDPRRFGIALIDNGKITGLVEKPKEPVGNHAIVGMYVFDSSIFDVIDRIKPSPGELEPYRCDYGIDKGWSPGELPIPRAGGAMWEGPRTFYGPQEDSGRPCRDVKGHVDANSTVGKSCYWRRHGSSGFGY